MGFDPFFDVAGEIVIQNRGRTSGLQFGNNFRYATACGSRRFDDCNGTMVLLDNHFQARLDLGKDCVKVARKFSFGDADHTHAQMIPVLPARCPGLSKWKCR